MDVTRVWQYLVFPLSVGKRWTSEYRAYTTMRLQVGVSVKAETHVSGIAEISSKAGAFKVFKIERNSLESAIAGTGTYAPGFSRHVTYTYFYSPEAQSIVRYARRGGGATVNIELLRFGSNRK